MAAVDATSFSGVVGASIFQISTWALENGHSAHPLMDTSLSEATTPAMPVLIPEAGDVRASHPALSQLEEELEHPCTTAASPRAALILASIHRW
jgi:hypothetical protein